MKNISKIVLIILLVALIPKKSLAGLATEHTQILNKIQLILQYGKQIEMITNQLKAYQNMLDNTQILSNQQWTDANSQIIQLGNLVRQGNSLAFTMSNLDAEFRRRFEGYDVYTQTTWKNGNLNSKYRSWAEQNRDTIQATLDTANLQYNDFTSEKAAYDNLESLSQSPAGRMQAIQIGNQIGGFQIEQLQKLRLLMMSQVNMQSQWIASENERQALQDARVKQAQDNALMPIRSDEPIIDSF